jgi:membrane protease YdiL (CAAX protease family)
MPLVRAEYLAATRHPWACVLFVLPLLAAYETGLLLLGPGQRDACRNGADIWLRNLLAGAGLRQWFWAPALLTLTLLAWSWLRRRHRPRDFVRLWVGMSAESVVFALGLCGVCHGLFPLLERSGLQVAQGGDLDPAVLQMLSFVGAGIYEETLFRLLLLSALAWLATQAELSAGGARALAILLSSLLFSLAHHIGPQGEAFQATVFLFRAFAGLYFALLYSFRGFGVAVGAHAGYDVLVGLLIEV